jgi:hypothetical protein
MSESNGPIRRTRIGSMIILIAEYRIFASLEHSIVSKPPV